LFSAGRHKKCVIALMQKEEIHLSDIERILFGNAPAEFLLEVFIRTIIVYFFLLIVMKLLGKRMSGQLTVTEMAVMLMLGAIVSSAMQTPQIGVLEGVFVLFLVLIFQRSLTLWILKNPRVQQTTEGKVSLMVKDGVVQLDQLLDTRISREQLFASLRKKHVINLGKIKRMYMEGSGDFSIYQFKEERPGLSLLPADDASIHETETTVDELMSCTRCGCTQSKKEKDLLCPVCGKNEWVPAVK
jgi:uncharacterized membrane protein YcaP (DUF421 family)